MAHRQSIVIIGGGVAGLSAGALLAREGFQVRLLEAGKKIGGCCATTTIQGFTFNDGALYLAFPGLLDHVFERLGGDISARPPIRKIRSPHAVMLPDGSVIRFGETKEVEVSGTGRPIDRARLQREIDRMLKTWAPLLKLFADDILVHPPSLVRILWKCGPYLPHMRGTVEKQLNNLFSDERIRAAMAGILLFAGVPPARMPATLLLGLVGLLTDGLYLPEGGMGKIPEALSATFLKHGGEIHLRTRVQRILLRGSRVVGVQTEDGRIDADAVLSTASGMTTFGGLLDQNAVSRTMKKKVEKSPLSHKAFAVQLGLSNRIDVPAHSISYLPMMEDQHRVFLPWSNDAEWPVYSVPTITMPELAPAGGSVVEIYPPTDQRIQVDEWDAPRKDAVAGAATESLKRHHRADIVVRRVVSPKEFRDEMGLYGGAVYGLSPVAGPLAYFPHATAIPGLFLAGQTTFPGFGVSSSAMSGLLAADALMRDSK